ncbi:MAG TPA: CHAT domain-containing protein [Methylomirabilota bacterium]|nr:CHAT domain-containing protein [Methylomirabilota bacterium]
MTPAPAHRPAPDRIRRSGAGFALALLLGITSVANLVIARDRPWTPPRARRDWSVRTAPPAHPDSSQVPIVPVVDVSLPLGRLTAILDGMGRFVDLPAFYEVEIEALKAAAGPQHPYLGCLHVRYAEYLWRHLPRPWVGSSFDPRIATLHSRMTGARTEALRAQVLTHAIAGEDILRESTRLALRGLPDAAARRLAYHRESALDLVLTLAASDATPEQLAVAWDAYLRSRNLVLDELAARQRSIVSTPDTTLARLWEALSAARSRLAQLSFSELRDHDRPAQAIAAARAEVDRLETAVASRSAGFRASLQQRSIGLRDVVQRLGADEALVGYAYYREAGNAAADSIQVLAFVWPAGAHAPELVRLGDAHPLDALADRWRRSLDKALAGDTAAAGRALATADSLRRRAWDPVAERVGKARRVFVVMDGALQFVNLSALPEDARGDSFVIERDPVIAYLGAERDLARAEPESGRGLLAMGGADFGGASAVAARRGVEADSAAGCRGIRTLHFGPLAATADEALFVGEQWRSSHPADSASDVRLCLGAAARERDIREYSGGREVLHLATHGFSVADSCFAGRRRSTGAERAARWTPPATDGDDPLYASGIALAGANDRSAAADPGDDGILTAAEIASLDLGGTRWVVLSACETALGVATSGEGVLGLRRAFTAAGAGTVIASLWRVEDRQALEFMRLLYTARFGDHESTPEAMREAALSMLQRRRALGLPPAPWAWGGFIAVGLPGSERYGDAR